MRHRAIDRRLAKLADAVQTATIETPADAARRIRRQESLNYAIAYAALLHAAGAIGGRLRLLIEQEQDRYCPGRMFQSDLVNRFKLAIRRGWKPNPLAPALLEFMLRFPATFNHSTVSCGNCFTPMPAAMGIWKRLKPERGSWQAVCIFFTKCPGCGGAVVTENGQPVAVPTLPWLPATPDGENWVFEFRFMERWPLYRIPR